MTLLDFQDMLHGLAQQCPMVPSPRIEDAVEVEVDDTRVAIMWREEGLIDLTVELPALVDETDDPSTLLALFRALLERQWLEMGGGEGVGFGLLPASNDVVGMATLDADALSGPDSFLAALQQAVISVQAEWYGVCAQILLQQTQAPAEPNEPPASSPLLSV